MNNAAIFPETVVTGSKISSSWAPDEWLSRKANTCPEATHEPCQKNHSVGSAASIRTDLTNTSDELDGTAAEVEGPRSVFTIDVEDICAGEHHSEDGEDSGSVLGAAGVLLHEAAGWPTRPAGSRRDVDSRIGSCSSNTCIESNKVESGAAEKVASRSTAKAYQNNGRRGDRMINLSVTDVDYSDLIRGRFNATSPAEQNGKDEKNRLTTLEAATPQEFCGSQSCCSVTREAIESEKYENNDQGVLVIDIAAQRVKNSSIGCPEDNLAREREFVIGQNSNYSSRTVSPWMMIYSGGSSSRSGRNANCDELLESHSLGGPSVECATITLCENHRNDMSCCALNECSARESTTSGRDCLLSAAVGGTLTPQWNDNSIASDTSGSRQPGPVETGFAIVGAAMNVAPLQEGGLQLHNVLRNPSDLALGSRTAILDQSSMEGMNGVREHCSSSAESRLPTDLCRSWVLGPAVSYCPPSKPDQLLPVLGASGHSLVASPWSCTEQRMSMAALQQQADSNDERLTKELVLGQASEESAEAVALTGISQLRSYRSQVDTTSRATHEQRHPFATADSMSGGSCGAVIGACGSVCRDWRQQCGQSGRDTGGNPLSRFTTAENDNAAATKGEGVQGAPWNPLGLVAGDSNVVLNNGGNSESSSSWTSDWGLDAAGAYLCTMGEKFPPDEAIDHHADRRVFYCEASAPGVLQEGGALLYGEDEKHLLAPELSGSVDSGEIDKGCGSGQSYVRLTRDGRKRLLIRPSRIICATLWCLMPTVLAELEKPGVSRKALCRAMVGRLYHGSPAPSPNFLVNTLLPVFCAGTTLGFDPNMYGRASLTALRIWVLSHHRGRTLLKQFRARYNAPTRQKFQPPPQQMPTAQMQATAWFERLPPPPKTAVDPFADLGPPLQASDDTLTPPDAGSSSQTSLPGLPTSGLQYFRLADASVY